MDIVIVYSDTLTHSLSIHGISPLCRSIAVYVVKALQSPHSTAHGYRICQTVTALRFVNAWMHGRKQGKAARMADDTCFMLNMNTLVSVEKQRLHGKRKVVGQSINLPKQWIGKSTESNWIPHCKQFSRTCLILTKQRFPKCVECFHHYADIKLEKKWIWLCLLK